MTCRRAVNYYLGHRWRSQLDYDTAGVVPLVPDRYMLSPAQQWHHQSAVRERRRDVSAGVHGEADRSGIIVSRQRSAWQHVSRAPVVPVTVAAASTTTDDATAYRRYDRRRPDDDDCPSLSSAASTLTTAVAITAPKNVKKRAKNRVQTLVRHRGRREGVDAPWPARCRGACGVAAVTAATSVGTPFPAARELMESFYLHAFISVL